MATRQSTAPARTAPAHQQQQTAARPEPSEDAADRIDAFLASMHTVQGRAVPRRIHAARVAINRIATHPSDDGIPDVDLTAQEVADVLHFLGAIEPKKPAIWWAGTEDRVSGLRTVLYALERNVRGESPSAEPTRFLEGDLVDKRLHAIRDRLWYAAGIVGCVIAAERKEGTTDAGNALQLVRRELQAIADNELYADELLAADEAQEVRS